MLFQVAMSLIAQIPTVHIHIVVLSYLNENYEKTHGKNLTYLKYSGNKLKHW